MSVRKSPPPPGPGTALTKRARVDDEDTDGSNMVMTVASSGEGQRKNALVRSIKRTSGLEAPIVSLSGAHAVSPIPLRPIYVHTVIRAFCLIFAFCEELQLPLAATDPQGEITACKFDPSGKTLAACSVDRSICKLARSLRCVSSPSSSMANIPSTRELRDIAKCAQAGDLGSSLLIRF